MISSQIQMLALAAETRQYTTIRLPPNQGGLPVVQLTALTLFGRTLQTLLTFSPQDRVISIAPLLNIARLSKRRASTYVQNWACEEDEVLRLARSPATIAQAIKLYRKTLPKIPFSSRTPWMLLRSCYTIQDAKYADVRWLVRSIRSMYSGKSQSVRELLIRAYIYTGDLENLRDSVLGVCVSPEALGSITLTGMFMELQDTEPDRGLACRLWTAMLDQPGFVPSQTCVQLALKLAIHSENIDLAKRTYQMILSGEWTGVEPGFWADKLMVYGLAINGLDIEASEVAMATNSPRMFENRFVAMQTVQKYELLLKGLSRTQRVDTAEEMFAYVRDDLGLYPTPLMYSSLLGVVACHREWNVVEEYLRTMEEEDELLASEHVWKRILLGAAQQARVDVCDKVLHIMASRGMSLSYSVVVAAVNAYSRLGNLELVVRWYNVVHQTLQVQAQTPLSQQRDVGISGVKKLSDMRGSTISKGPVCEMDQMDDPPRPYSIEQPEAFIAYFIHRKELIWHRDVLACVLETVGYMGDAVLLMRIWEDILMFQQKVRTLRLSPYIFMVLARSLARLKILSRYDDPFQAWVCDQSNQFTKSQIDEIMRFVGVCKANHRNAKLHPSIHPRANPLNDCSGDKELEPNDSVDLNSCVGPADANIEAEAAVYSTTTTK
ncbi:hypothetical protein GGI23_001304 [Coemansia sp. RSA 2559]|nr:hypothetical protein GGI23_001304 [Coemansia sp. RSA 2559]KAJ2857309.1 hypothetical protein GGI22_003546 [Coemansia erecta]